MTFDTKTLEFKKIKERVAVYANTLLGKKKIIEIEPSANPLLINRLLNETAQANTLLMHELYPPFGGVRDVTNHLKKARVYDILTPREFLDIVDLLNGINAQVLYFKKILEEEFTIDALTPYYQEFEQFTALKKEIKQIITDDANVASTASHELSRIRSKIDTLERRIQEKLTQVMKSKKDALADQLITIRNEHYVVPVKLSEKNKFDGAIIDYSSSGETVYMEPRVVTETINQIQLLKMEEQKEVERILRDLTIRLAEDVHALSKNLELIITLDTIFAKANYALETESTKPTITENEVYLRKARHPLIDPKEVVANTMYFEQGKQMIIITGPNTGGKTVALKTMGLLSIMLQSGLLIPVAEDSKTKIFEQILADIGDEQSIEQSLSTFSSHMTRIIHILEVLKEDALILLDELGSGTDPKEGASLAISLLEHLKKQHVYVMATTHYPELKAYAYNHQSILNASVEFDVQSLKPTYRLLIGTPGKSNALLISERLGLPKHIIEHAKNNIITSATDVSELIEKLEHEGNRLDQKLQEYELLLNDNKRLKDELIEEKRKLRDEQMRLRDKTTVLNADVVKETKMKAETLIKELEELKSSQELKTHEIADIKHKVRSFAIEEDTKRKTDDHVFKKGDRVNILKFNRVGELIKKQKKDTWEVKMGALSSTFKEDELEFVDRPKKEEPKAKMKSHVKKKAYTTLDLRGMRYEEAQDTLDKYVDDCLLSHVPQATIIHGYGTLALRQMVKEYVAKHPSITTYRDGGQNEGGSGTTIIYFE
ncbi:MAG: endonuclease MutS2 [Candidatus Izemoplasmataceae bacterium]